MRTIGAIRLMSFGDGSGILQELENTEIRHSKGHLVKSYFELAKKVSELSFANPDHVLMYRGQNSDFRNSEDNTTLKPSILRGTKNDPTLPRGERLRRRFDALQTAEEQLIQEYERHRIEGGTRLRRQRILRWALLQHYEICLTPLLDVTHSLRIAASFASIDCTADAFVYVLAVPNLSGVVTASAEVGTQTVRLSSICPPRAVRPHIQEGYLLGEYPDLTDYPQKRQYDASEMDFGRRLIAKFRFKPKTFWNDQAFPMVGRDALYPDDRDSLFRVAARIKSRLTQQD